MGFSSLKGFKSLPDMNKIQKNMETVFSNKISYGTFLAQKVFMTRNLRIHMLKKHLKRVRGIEK